MTPQVETGKRKPEVQRFMFNEFDGAKLAAILDPLWKHVRHCEEWNNFSTMVDGEKYTIIVQFFPKYYGHDSLREVSLARGSIIESRLVGVNSAEIDLSQGIAKFISDQGTYTISRGGFKHRTETRGEHGANNWSTNWVGTPQQPY